MVRSLKIVPSFLIFMINVQLLSQELFVTPMPNYLEKKQGQFLLSSETWISFTSESEVEMGYFQNYIQDQFSIKLGTKPIQSIRANRIVFEKQESIAKEGYEIEITEGSLVIKANSRSGWFYAVQTLKQIFEFNSRYSKYEKTIAINAMEIKDSPRFSWRAFMLDEARYFKGKEQVKLLLDEMARLKMNVFHWHLVDDQGWRIEIKKYPKLTEIGSKRKSTQIGPLQWDSPIQSGEPHSGFYTQEEIKEIIAYAKERHINIVPEIEMPGHSSAAIASYYWLGTSKKQIEVPIRFGVGKDVYDVTDARVNRFLQDVLNEVMALFPSKVIHIGGDEVKYNHWKGSYSVRQYMKNKGLKTPADLQVYFTNQISKYLESKGRRMMGWNEIMGHNLHYYQDQRDTETSQKLAPNAIVHFWKGDVTLAETAAKNGYEIVNSLHSATYLDYSYKNLPLTKAYQFNPIPEKLDSKYHDKIIGLGCQMWGEWIPTNGNMHFQVFPRIAAYAEVGWTNLSKKDYSKFSRNLKNLQKLWASKGIYYAPEDFHNK